VTNFKYLKNIIIIIVLLVKLIDEFCHIAARTDLSVLWVKLIAHSNVAEGTDRPVLFLELINQFCNVAAGTD